MEKLCISSEINPTLDTPAAGESQFKSIANFAIISRYKRGDTIIQPGAKIEHLHYLQSGLLRLYIYSNDGEILFYNIFPKTTFGEPAFFKDSPTIIRALAVEDSIVYKFPRDKIMSCLNGNDYIFKMLINTLCAKIYLITTLLENMSNTDCKVKLANVLYMLAIQNNLKKEIKITHDELALMIGTHRVTITRNLAKLQKDGLIKTARNIIIIEDIKRLKESNYPV